MKKTIYFALAIVALTSSCNKELVDDQTLNVV